MLETKAHLPHSTWTAGKPLHVRASIQVYTGDLVYTRRWEEAPIKLTPPYFASTSAATQLSSDKHATMELCNVGVHDIMYLGFKGGHKCAEYVVSLHYFGEGNSMVGQDLVTINGTTTPATHGHYQGYHFHAYDFREHPETLVVLVDGHMQSLNLTTHVADVDCAVAALSGLVGAYAQSTADGQLDIVAMSVGHNSKIDLDTAHSGKHSLLLFFDACTEFEGEHKEVSYTQSLVLVPGHYTKGSCAVGGYDIFTVHVANAASNLEIMLEDITGEPNTNSLTMKVFHNTLPKDLESELQSHFTADGTYSISINSHELKAGTYYVMVRCQVTAVSYRIVPILTPGGYFHLPSFVAH